MENHNGASGRKRGLTKHSVEDQALDQIAKEKLVSLGRSGDEKRDEDASPQIPENVNDEEDSSSKDDNSTGRDVSELSDSVGKTRKFDSEDEEWLPNDNEQRMLVGQEEEGKKKKKRKGKKDRRKSEASNKTSLSLSDKSTATDSFEKKSEKQDAVEPVVASRKFDSEDEQWLAADEEKMSPKNTRVIDSGDDEKSLSLPKNESIGEEVPKTSRKFDSEDEQWLAEKSSSSPKNESSEELPKVSRKFDSEDEQWPSENIDEPSKTTRKFDSEDEEWLADAAKTEETEKEQLEENPAVVARKFDSEDEDWLGNDEGNFEEIFDKSASLETERNGGKSVSQETDGKIESNEENSQETEQDCLDINDSSQPSIADKESERQPSAGSEKSPQRQSDNEDWLQTEKSTDSEMKEKSLSPKTENDEEEWSPDTSKNDETKETSTNSSSDVSTSVESSHDSLTSEPAVQPEETELKQVHQRNFAKALQDIGSQQQRRRSVIIPDQRERIVHEERSHRVSESSTDDGETTHDDGIIDFLGKENDRAEARLAARRQARVEAREIRMRELERVQKEQEETSDKVFDLHTPVRQPSMSPRERPTSTNSYHSSRRSSEDSMEDGGISLRDLRHELKEVEEKFRKAMIANAQLDNEKAAHAYQVELLKDKLEDLEEAHSLLGREHRERCREHEALKRATLKLKEELTICRMQLEERDRLIADYGLIIVGGDINEKGEVTPRELVSNQAAEVLESAGEGSLDVRLKNLAKDKNDLLDEVRHLKLELEEERTQRQHEQSLTNGPLSDDVVQTLNDYRFRLQKAEQETSTLQATVARLESQVIRYKSAAEESEKAEDELKTEKRKLLREHRESIARIEELETSNSHLQRRMDKLKNAKSTLLKEL